VTTRESRFDRDGSALHPPQREQALSKRVNEWIRRAGPAIEHGHAVGRAELLRRRVKRRGESAARPVTNARRFIVGAMLAPGEHVGKVRAR
jgi:hypothetical protein